jgi:serine/threonine protein kinase
MTITQPTTPSKSGARRANALPSACMLDEYRIDSILGAGGFGVTYKALDTHLETWVAIKEYFPVEWSFRDADGVTVYPNSQGEASGPEGQLSDYLWGLERFLDEARVLARVQHPYVVRVKRYFRAHGTAYIVMDYEEGEPLSAVLRDGETLGEDEVRGLLEDVLPALQAVHEQGYLHRDIKPSNLYLRSSDHRVILIDFGAAREAVGRHSKSVTSLVTPGYSPPEQYTTRNDRYGTWTDIYALGAVLYRCITGHVPIEAAERLLDDHLEPALKVGAGRYSTNLLEVIDRALAVRPERRFLTVADMQAALLGPQDQDSSQTVIMMPLSRPVKLAQPLGTSRITRRPETSTEESIGDDQHDWLNVTQAPTTADSQLARQRQIILQASPPGGTAFRWRLPVILAGGVTLMAAAAAIIWLGSSEPALEREPASEQKPPPRYSLNQGESPPAPVESPTPVEREVTSPPIPVEAPEKPPVAGPGQEPTGTGEMPEAVHSESAPPLPASGMTGVPLPGMAPAVTTKPPADAPAERTTKPATDQKPQARDAAPPPKRPTRQRTVRKRKEPPIVVTPARPVQARPAPAPKRNNLWEAPTDSGFNQK